MKKIALIAAVIALALTLTACGPEKPAADSAKVTEQTPVTDSRSSGSVPTVDYAAALVDADSASYRNIYESDGLAHDSSYAIPKINIDLPEANALSEKIRSDFDNLFGTYFSVLDDLSGENVRKTGEDEYTLNITYSYTVEYDMVTVIMRVQIDFIDTSREQQIGYLVYHYDALEDSEHSIFEYSSYCGTSIPEIAEEVGKKIDGFSDDTPFDADLVKEGAYEFTVYSSDGDCVIPSLYNVVTDVTVTPTSLPTSN